MIEVMVEPIGLMGAVDICSVLLANVRRVPLHSSPRDWISHIK